MSFAGPVDLSGLRDSAQARVAVVFRPGPESGSAPMCATRLGF